MSTKIIKHILLITLLLTTQAAQAGVLSKWMAQTVYVPVYSHIYADDRYRGKPFLLTVTLSVRNTDPGKSLSLQSVNYHDSQGKLLRKYLDKPTNIGPLGSASFIVPESETEGGSGAKFIVEWEADSPIIEPIIESVMIGTQLQQGISFISTGRVMKGKPAANP